MAIANFSTYKTLRDNPFAQAQFGKQSFAIQNGRLCSLWATGFVAQGAAPTTAAVPTSATVGALGQPNAGGGLALYPTSTSLNPGSEGLWLLCDRLSHQGGLDGTSLIAQVTNLPTAALTRYTGGVGVWAGLEVYTTIGATPQTATAVYTNQAGTPALNTQASVIGGTGYREAGRIIPLALAAGDTGFQGVTSVLLSGSTGTAGNFGVTLFKPLLALPAVTARAVHDLGALLALGCQIPEIVADACLFWCVVAGERGATGTLEGVINFSEA